MHWKQAKYAQKGFESVQFEKKSCWQILKLQSTR